MPVRSTCIAAPVLAAAISLMLVACGGDDSPTVGDALTSDSTTTTAAAASGDATTTTAHDHATAEAKVIEVSVVNGTVDGGVRKETVKLGEHVTLRVISTTADQVHVHGYDKEFDVGPGKTGELALELTIPGVFEVEMHHTGKEILKLEVTP